MIRPIWKYFDELANLVKLWANNPPVQDSATDIVIFFVLLFFYSFCAVKDSESEFKNKDPRQIVIDEVLGQSMPLILLLYLNQTNQISISIEIYYILSFVFFRFFDILKPFPVSYFDKNHKNYFGIIMDDIMAGLYSMILIYIISLKF